MKKIQFFYYYLFIINKWVFFLPVYTLANIHIALHKHHGRNFEIQLSSSAYLQWNKISEVVYFSFNLRVTCSFRKAGNASLRTVFCFWLSLQTVQIYFLISYCLQEHIRLTIYRQIWAFRREIHYYLTNQLRYFIIIIRLCRLT